MTTIPEITTHELSEAMKSGEDWDYLFLFIDKNLEMVAIDPTREVMKQFNEYQHALLAYSYLYWEVKQGGFTQLIQKGFGNYIFERSFSRMSRVFGAEKVANIIDKAKDIYLKKKDELEHSTWIEVPVPNDFESLENEFDQIAEEETRKMRNYVSKNVEKFAEIRE